MSRSDDLYERAQRSIPGGVNSPVRSFGAVGGTPRFIARAKGARIVDADGAELVDLVMSWGALLFGHAHPVVTGAIRRAAEHGSSYGAPTEAEVLFAERLCDAVPSLDKVRLVSSGTEATMSAIRLARAATGRDAIIKFAGCYHGHSDALLATAGSGLATLGIPGTPGVTAAAASDTIVVPYNDIASCEQATAARPIAAVIVEPVAANMGIVPPSAGFLEGLRALCDRTGALLIFDEVVTGFRLARGGAQERFGVRPDLTCLGKVIGAGMPIGAFGGRADVMEQIAPSGPVYQAGTLSGNPVAVAAGLAVLDLIEQTPPYETMERHARMLCDALSPLGSVTMSRCGSLVSLFFLEEQPTSFVDASQPYPSFFHGMLERGIYLPPSAFEGWFLSAAHTDEDVERTIAAARAVLRDGGF